MKHDISTLMKELREVDQQTYSKISKTIRHYEIAPHLDAPIIQDHILGCILRAIAANNWQLTQLAMANWHRPYPNQAAIKKAPNENWISGFGDTPAVAILAAYIEAKRAVQ